MSSLRFNNAYINSSFSIAGPEERLGKIKNFDLTFDDYYFNEKTFEKAEIRMQRIAINRLLALINKKANDIDLLISGDLSNQIANSSYATKYFDIPYLGIYSACATFCESLIIAATFLDNKQLKNIIAVTSSHNLTAEKEFRFPIEYGSPKKQTSTNTATGCVSTFISSNKSTIKIESATIGRIVDLDIKDPNHFGAAMAPAAADTIYNHLKDLDRKPSYYDLILTGDLGKYGSKLLLKYLKINNDIILNNHMDAGTEVFCDSQNKNAGSSGPVTIPLVFFNKILKEKKYKRILLVATGALHSPLLLNQKESIPAISHAVSIEVIR